MKKQTKTAKISIEEAKKLANEYEAVAIATASLEKERDIKLLNVKQDYIEPLAELEAKQEALFEKLHLFAEQEKNGLLFGGQKSALLENLVLRFRLGNRKVELGEMTEDQVIGKLLLDGNHQYIRFRAELDRKMILEQEKKDKILEDLGISVSQTNRFSVEVTKKLPI